MSKAEKFIQENTSIFSNKDGFDYVPWLTPDDARKAVEIAKEEMIDKACEWLSKNSPDYINYFISHDFKKFVEDFRKAQKGE